MNWKIITASVAGTSHLAKNELCDDAFACEIVNAQEGEILIVIVSDGAGSVKNGRTRAQMTFAFTNQGIRSWFERGGKVAELNKDFGTNLLNCLQSELAKEAAKDGQTSQDFACTFLAAIVGVDSAAFFQIGDGAIVYSANDGAENYNLISLPQQGEYANSTNFVTDLTVSDVLQFEMIEKRIDEIAVFTDGLQRIALDYKSKAAHAPFFRPMFAPLRTATETADLQKRLIDFLNSPKINERTDDDKTLILASRR